MPGDSARSPGFVTWPEKLITQAEAFVLAADWPVYAAVSGDDINLHCGKCDRSTGQLRRGLVNGTIYNGSLDEMLSAVLRHMVMAHDVPLAGLRKEHDGT